MSVLVGRDTLVKSLFFLFLGLVGGLVRRGIMSCGIQKMILEGIYVKHIIFFVLIFFSIGFVNANAVSPINIFLSALVIYTIFMILMKSEKEYVLAAVLILGVIYVLNKLRETYDPIADASTIETIETITNLMVWIIGITVAVGFILYYRRQSSEHSKTFSLNKFFFGTNKCESLVKA
jgi:hypothetical protein